MALPDSEHYYIEKTSDPEHESLECYGVTNKETEVTEYYDNLLPRAYEAMLSMEEKVVEMLVSIERNAKSPLSVVEALPSKTEH